MIDRLSPAVIALWLIFFATAQGALTQGTPPPSTPSTNTSSEVSRVTEKTAVVPVIGTGDLLKVGVLGAPESDQEIRVGADGNVVLNFIGPVHVAGLTPAEAQAIIATKLVTGGFFTDPQVSVFCKEYATQGVSVLGEVQKPNVYPLLGSRRLFDVLSLAGGTTPRAGQVITITHRDRLGSYVRSCFRTILVNRRTPMWKSFLAIL